MTYLPVGVSTMGEAGPDHQLRRSHSEQDLWTRQQQLARAAEFYTAVGPDGEITTRLDTFAENIKTRSERSIKFAFI